MNSSDALGSYLSALEAARARFRNRHPQALTCMEGIASNFAILKAAEQQLAEAGSKRSRTAPFLQIMERQTLSAFDAISTYRSVPATGALRPAIEAALITGKWLDDEDNVSIFLSREGNLHQFTRSFTGLAVISRSLRCSAALQIFLKKADETALSVTPAAYTALLAQATGSAETDGYLDTDEVLTAHLNEILPLLINAQQDLLLAYGDTRRLTPAPADL